MYGPAKVSKYIGKKKRYREGRRFFDKKRFFVDFCWFSGDNKKIIKKRYRGKKKDIGKGGRFFD